MPKMFPAKQQMWKKIHNIARSLKRRHFEIEKPNKTTKAQAVEMLLLASPTISPEIAVKKLKRFGIHVKPAFVRLTKFRLMKKRVVMPAGKKHELVPLIHSAKPQTKKTFKGVPLVYAKPTRKISSGRKAKIFSYQDSETFSNIHTIEARIRRELIQSKGKKSFKDIARKAKVTAGHVMDVATKMEKESKKLERKGLEGFNISLRDARKPLQK